jgi:heme-degrading monooxygenase HmoA
MRIEDTTESHTAWLYYLLTCLDFWGVELACSANGLITVSYWKSQDAIQAWKTHSEHKLAQEAGKKLWCADYILRLAKFGRA